MNQHMRDRILAEWRGYAEAPAKPDRCQSLAALVPGVVQKLGLGEKLGEEQMRAAWCELVGEFLAAHSMPSRLRGGILYVQVLQPTVHFELERNWKPMIVEKLKSRFGSKIIRDVRFVVG